MKYIITEQQLETTIKKFKKDDADRGELGHVMEELVISYMDGNLCDVVGIKVPKSLDYVVLVLTPNYYGNETEIRIARHIENYLGVNAMVFLKKSENCDKIDE